MMTSFCSPNDAGQCFPASHLVLKAIEDGNQGLPCSRISCNSSLKSRSTNELDESAHQKGPVMPSPQKSPTKSTEDTEGLSPGKLNEHPSKMASVQMTAMPVGFTPGPYDVLCGRGRLCKNAAGNHAYRKVVMQYLEAYAAASSKIAKGDIISKIVRDICSKCHAYHGSAVGGFIKSIGGVWFSVGEFLAREKTSQIFRDALSETYCSSAQSKYLRRRARSLKERSKQQPHTSGSEMKCSNLVPEGVSANLELKSAQAAPKKHKRRPSEDDVADVLKHMATFSQPPPLRSFCSAPSYNTSMVSFSNTTRIDLSEQSSQLASVLQLKPTSSSSTLHLFPALAREITMVLPGMTNATTGSRTGASGDEIRVCALQPALRPPCESPWEALRRVQLQMETIAATETVDVFVLPELAPLGYSEDTFAKFLPVNAANQAMYQEFDILFRILAQKLQAYVCYGTIGWSVPTHNEWCDPMDEGDIPRMSIRQVVVDRLGNQVAIYDKTNLCDYGDCAETRFFQPGPASHPTSFQIRSRDGRRTFRFGLLICADMRYPDLARKLTGDAKHRVDCILQPAAFVRDCSFRTWCSFRETRAVENSIFWIGVNYSGTDFGESSIVPPWVDGDHEPIKLGCEVGYVIGRVTRCALDHARNNLPFYSHLLLEEALKARAQNR